MKRIYIAIFLIFLFVVKLNCQVKIVIENLKVEKNKLPLVTLNVINEGNSDLLIKNIRNYIPDSISKYDRFASFYFVIFDEDRFVVYNEKFHITQYNVRPKTKGKSIKIKGKEHITLKFILELSDFELNDKRYFLHFSLKLDNSIYYSNEVILNVN